MKKYFLFAILICCITMQAQQYAAIDSLIATYKGADQFSGVILVADKGHVQYEKAFGYRDFARQTALQPTDIFELASVSKQFTAMIIMILKEKGLLNYDDPLQKYINLPYTGITIRNLLTHTSGLPDYQAVMDAHWDKTKIAGNNDVIAYLNQYQPPKLFEPGEKYMYSNTGYLLLASVAEKATGKNFITLCREYIFTPLHMRSTDIRTAEEKSRLNNFAIGHIYTSEKNDFVTALSFPSSNYTIWLGNRTGPGRISSAAQDLLLWDQALYTDKIVKQSTLAEAFTPFKLNDGTVSNYGFGWVIVPAGSAGKIVWHNGDNPGYKTGIFRFIDKKKTLIVLTNNAPAKFDTITRQLQSIVIK